MRALRSRRLLLWQSALLVGLLAAPGCVVEEVAESGAFACQSAGQCLSGFHCDRVTETCVRGPAPDARAVDGAATSDASMPTDGEPRLDREVRPDRAVAPDARAPDGRFDAETDAETDAWTDAALPPDAAAPEACGADSEAFKACYAEGEVGAVCIRGACCPLNDVSLGCNPSQPGFRNPPAILNVGQQRFDVFWYQLLQGVPGGLPGVPEQRIALADLGTDLVWTHLFGETPADALTADEACRRLAIPAEAPPPFANRRFRLPDAYELWSLLAAAPRAQSMEPWFSQLFNDLGITGGGLDYLVIPTRTVDQDGAFHGVHFESRRGKLMGSENHPSVENLQLRVLCVSGGRQQARFRDEARAQMFDPETGWSDVWSGLTWNATRPVPYVDSATGSRQTVASLQAVCSQRGRAPTTADVMARLDLGGDGRNWTVRDWFLALGPAHNAPIWASDPGSVYPVLVVPERGQVITVEDALADADLRDQIPKFYCLTPTEP